MAGGNWTEFAWDENGKPTGGRLETPDKAGIQIYKNWLYLHKRKGRGVYDGIVGEIFDGSIQYLDLNVMASRGKQEGIYFIAWHGWEHEGTMKGIAGIGCAGYENGEWVGVLDETKKDFLSWLEIARKIYPYPPRDFIDVLVKGKAT